MNLVAHKKSREFAIFFFIGKKNYFESKFNNMMEKISEYNHIYRTFTFNQIMFTLATRP